MVNRFLTRLPKPLMEKEQSLQQLVLGQMDIHMQRMKLDPLYHIQKLLEMEQRPQCKT